MSFNHAVELFGERRRLEALARGEDGDGRNTVPPRAPVSMRAPIAGMIRAGDTLAKNRFPPPAIRSDDALHLRHRRRLARRSRSAPPRRSARARSDARAARALAPPTSSGATRWRTARRSTATASAPRSRCSMRRSISSRHATWSRRSARSSRRPRRCWTSAAARARPARRGRCRPAACRSSGIDRHPWAVEEARWTYRTARPRAGTARQGDATRLPALQAGKRGDRRVRAERIA